MKFGCYSADKQSSLEIFWKFDSIFADPRLSKSQRKRLIDDFFDYSIKICPIGDEEGHLEEKVSGFNRILAVPHIMRKGEKYIDQEIVETILNSILNFHTREAYLNQYDLSLEAYFETLRWLFTSNKLSRKCFWKNFNIVSKFLEETPTRDEILEGKNTKKIFLEILKNSLVTSRDIKNLCHNPYGFIRHIAVEHPLSSKENKIIVALMDSGIY